MAMDFIVDSQSKKTFLESNSTCNQSLFSQFILDEPKEQRVSLKEIAINQKLTDLNNNLEKQSNNIGSKKWQVTLEDVVNEQKTKEPVLKSRRRSKLNLAPVSRTTRSKTKATVT